MMNMEIKMIFKMKIRIKMMMIRLELTGLPTPLEVVAIYDVDNYDEDNYDTDN